VKKNTQNSNIPEKKAKNMNFKKTKNKVKIIRFASQASKEKGTSNRRIKAEKNQKQLRKLQ
jgi:hypothetical protein